MSEYTFKPTQRRTIFEVYREKCFHCGKQVLFSEMDIDHLIPESILSSPLKLEQLKAECVLDNDFEINSYYNWVLSCESCNSHKRGMILPEGRLSILLHQVRDKYEKAIEIERKIKSKRLTGKFLSDLEINLSKGLPFSEIEDRVLAENNSKKDLIIPYVNHFSTLIQDKEYKKAIRCIEKVLKAYPEDGTGFLYYALGFCYLTMDKYQRAIDICTKSISINSDFPQAYFIRGQAYFVPYYKNLFSKDCEIFDPLTRIDSFQDDFTAMNDLHNAISNYSNALEKDSDYADAYYWRAICKLFIAVRFRTQCFDWLYLPFEPIDDLKIAVKLYWKQSNRAKCELALETYSQLIDMYADIFPEHEDTKQLKQLLEQLNSTYFSN